MKQHNWKAAVRAAAGRHQSRRGALAAALMALAVAAVVLVNLLAGQLPASWTQFDMTGSGIYDISQVSVDYLTALDQDVEIHVLADEDGVDDRIVRFLERYEALSDRLSVTYTDPVIYPSVLTQYGVEADTVVVTCAATGRQESFALDEIIGYDMMSYYLYGTYTETDFDAEGLLTSAVDGVLSGATRTVYQTTGHGETALPQEVEDLFAKVHMAVESVNLLVNGGIPEDCSLLIISEPVRDLADDELTLLLDYLAAGGHVIYNMSGEVWDLPNFSALCATYGMNVADGLIADPARCYQTTPYLFFPLVDTSVDAADSFSHDSTVLVYASRGMTLTDPVRDTISVQSFLTTSDQAVAVADADTQVPGTYSVGAVATEEIDDGITARLTVYGSASLIDEDITGGFANLDNTALFMSSAVCGFEDVENLSIEPVSLEMPYNTITTGGIWALLFVLVIPGMLLLCGFFRWMRRRKL